MTINNNNNNRIKLLVIRNRSTAKYNKIKIMLIGSLILNSLMILMKWITRPKKSFVLKIKKTIQK